MSKLVIVESPSKAKTIAKILGEGYEVISSKGHVVDLPKNKLGIDDNFEPEYVVDKAKEKFVKETKDKVKKSSSVLLASDPDREGEAIAYHLATLFNLSGKIRIEFNEITEKAVVNALDKVREIDINKVNSQQARRILDRIVGYEISPLLWKKLGYGTSAGRVQSVALKLICELEDEIKKFVPEKFFLVSGIFNKILLELFKINGEKVDKLKDEVIVEKILSLKGETFKVIFNEIKQKKSFPPLPFKTSSLQQAASTELGFSPSRTMKLAQDLYSGVEVNRSLKGLITYIRTDSFRISDDAKDEALKYILENFGKNYYQKRVEKQDKKIQDAHEAIRPTSLKATPESLRKYLKDDQLKLYSLIYKRFLASQMSDMEYDQLDLIAERDEFQFRALFNKITFPGYTKVLDKHVDDYVTQFPKIEEALVLEEIEAKHSETKPPARFSEAALIKKLESEGIGRPSTYATIVETLKAREYVNLEEKKFIPTNLGYILKEILVENFPNIMDVKFTSFLETELDEIEQGNKNWRDILKKFDEELQNYISKYKENINKIIKVIDTDANCEECKEKMFFKRGRFGPYLECANSHKKSLPDNLIDYQEEKQGFLNISKELSNIKKKKEGKLTDLFIDGKQAILKEGPYGYYVEAELNGQKIRKSIPKEMKLDLNQKVVEVSFKINEIERKQRALEESAAPCEKCNSKMIVKKGKWGMFFSCSNYPTCKNIRKFIKKN